MSRTYKDVPRRALKSGYKETHYGCEFDTSFSNQGGRIVGITNHPARYTTDPELHDVEYLVRPDGCAHPIDRVRVEDISSSKAYFLEGFYKFTYYSNRGFFGPSVRSNDRDTFLDMVKEYNSTGEVISVEDEIHWYN